MAEKQLESIHLAFPVTPGLTFENAAKVVAILVKNGYVAAIRHKTEGFSDNLIKQELLKVGVKFARRVTDYRYMGVFVWETDGSENPRDIPKDRTTVYLEVDSVEKITGRRPHPSYHKDVEQIIAHIEKLARQALGLE